MMHRVPGGSGRPVAEGCKLNRRCRTQPKYRRRVLMLLYRVGENVRKGEDPFDVDRMVDVVARYNYIMFKSTDITSTPDLHSTQMEK